MVYIVAEYQWLIVAGTQRKEVVARINVYVTCFVDSYTYGYQ